MEKPMNHINHYASRLHIITAIPAEKISAPVNIPVNTYLMEAECLKNWCLFDKDKLTANGLDWSLVEDLPARIDILRDAQSAWSASCSDIDLNARWKAIKAEAVELRLLLTRAMRFIFRDDTAALALIRKFSEGRSNSAIIQSLCDISIFGEMNTELFQNAGINTEQLHRAAELSREMAALDAEVRCALNTPDLKLTIRNQAFTYLEEAVEEIRLHAKYVLWRDPVRLKGYASEYVRKKNRRYKQNKKAKEHTEESITHPAAEKHSAEPFKPLADTSNIKTRTQKLKTNKPKPETDTTKLKTKTTEAKTNMPGSKTSAMEYYTEGKITLIDKPGMQTDTLIH